MCKSTLPFPHYVTEVEAYRKPTAREMVNGYGSAHYKTFPVALWKNKQGMPKCWIVCPEDKLRYYR